MNQINENYFEESAQLFKALGHPVRLAMLEALRDESWCVCELADNLGINKSAASKHLSLLNKLGVIKMEKEGTRVNCSLQMRCVTQMMQCAIDKE
jgi:DNA-binding transcriptional ArsR family regulator